MTYLEFFGNVRDLNLLSILLRFVLAVLCSGIIGLERGRRQHAAGQLEQAGRHVYQERLEPAGICGV